MYIGFRLLIILQISRFKVWRNLIQKQPSKGVHPCRSALSIKLLFNFIEIALQHGCFPVNLLHIFRTSFTENTYGGVLLLISVLFLFALSYFPRLLKQSLSLNLRLLFKVALILLLKLLCKDSTLEENN